MIILAASLTRASASARRAGKAAHLFVERYLHRCLQANRVNSPDSRRLTRRRRRPESSTRGLGLSLPGPTDHTPPSIARWANARPYDSASARVSKVRLGETVNFV